MECLSRWTATARWIVSPDDLSKSRWNASPDGRPRPDGLSLPMTCPSPDGMSLPMDGHGPMGCLSRWLSVQLQPKQAQLPPSFQQQQRLRPRPDGLFLPIESRWIVSPDRVLHMLLQRSPMAIKFPDRNLPDTVSRHPIDCLFPMESR